MCQFFFGVVSIFITFSVVEIFHELGGRIAQMQGNGFGKHFSGIVFAFFSVGFGLVTRSRKELSIRQVIARHILHLALIEAFVFGVNYLSGVLFSWKIGIALALAIAIIFAMVYTVMYMNDRKSAALFNEKLKQYQEDAANREG